MSVIDRFRTPIGDKKLSNLIGLMLLYSLLMFGVIFILTIYFSVTSVYSELSLLQEGVYYGFQVLFYFSIYLIGANLVYRRIYDHTKDQAVILKLKRKFTITWTIYFLLLYLLMPVLYCYGGVLIFPTVISLYRYSNISVSD